MVPNDLLDLVALEVGLRRLVEVQNDPGAAMRRCFHGKRRDGVGTLAVRSPAIGEIRPGPVRLDDDVIRDHESRVEPDAELADQVGIDLRLLGTLGSAELVEEGACAGARDRAQRAIEILFRHADPVVGDGEGLGVLVDADGDREGLFVGGQGGIGDGLVAKLFAGVGPVGDQLA